MLQLIKKPINGSFLISEPFLKDPSFKRTVILVTEHNEQGTVGFVLSNPTNMKINDVMYDFPQFNSSLYIGGPVKNDTLHFIHKSGKLLDGSIPIIEDVYWSGNFETLKLLIDSNQINNTDIIFFLGYSGWGPGQLDEEIKTNSWLITTANKEFIFHNNPQNLWCNVLKSMGKEYAIMANFPQDPSLN